MSKVRVTLTSKPGVIPINAVVVADQVAEVEVENE